MKPRHVVSEAVQFSTVTAGVIVRLLATTKCVIYTVMGTAIVLSHSEMPVVVVLSKTENLFHFTPFVDEFVAWQDSDLFRRGLSPIPRCRHHTLPKGEQEKHHDFRSTLPFECESK